MPTAEAAIRYGWRSLAAPVPQASAALRVIAINRSRPNNTRINRIDNEKNGLLVSSENDSTRDEGHRASQCVLLPIYSRPFAAVRVHSRFSLALASLRVHSRFSPALASLRGHSRFSPAPFAPVRGHSRFSRDHSPSFVFFAVPSSFRGRSKASPAQIETAGSS